MRLVNVHTFSPQSPWQTIGLWCSYTPSLIALMIMLAAMVPYIANFCFATVLPVTGLWSSWFLWSFLGGLFVFTLLLTSFARAIFTPAGYVDPTLWQRQPLLVADDPALYDVPAVVKRLPGGGFRFCATCNIYKPDDARHCSDCNRCVSKMDHHCPWINNCVGRDNEKFFFLFIAYVPVCAFHILLTIWLFYHKAEKFTFRSTHMTNGIVAIVAAVFGLVLGSFACFHAFLVATSQSTLDHKFRSDRQQRSCCWRWATCNMPPRKLVLARFDAMLGERRSLWASPWHAPAAADARSHKFEV